MKIFQQGKTEIEALGKCAVVSSGGIAAFVIADLHIGYEEALNKQGMLIQRFQFREMMKGIDKALSAIALQKKKIDIAIIAGDLKHEFGTISEQEWREALSVTDFLSKKIGRVVLIKGNHDKILGPIAGRRGVEIKESMKIGDVLIIHGERLPKRDELSGIKNILMGHEHPAVSIREGIRAELFKCFLIGRWKGFNLIVVPSFSTLTEGTDVLKGELLSPLLKGGNLLKFRAVLCGEALSNYDFGALSGLIKIR